METIKLVPDLSGKQIKNIAEKAYCDLNAEDLFPVPIDKILELKLGYSIIPIPRLKKDLDIDSFITKDKELYIDEEIYMAENNQRYRFSLAHELGHITLHETLFKHINAIDDFVLFYKTTPDYILGKLESQSDRFASFFLCPYKYIDIAIRNFVIKPYADSGIKNINKDKTKEAVEYQIAKIANYFNVSSKAMMVRMARYFENNL